MFKRTSAFMVAFQLSLLAKAQAPGGIPYGDPEAIEFNLFNTIFFIVLPLLLIFFYIWYRKKKRKRK